MAPCVWLRLLPILSLGCSPQRDVVATIECRAATLGHAGIFGGTGVFNGWLARETSEGATSLEASVLTAALLAPYQVLIAQDVRLGTLGKSAAGSGIGRAYTADEVEALRQWVVAGGGLMTLPAYSDSTEIANVNSLLAPFGLSYGAQQVFSVNTLTTTPVTHWGDHPLTWGITKVGVNNAYPVLGGGALIAWEPVVGQYDLGRAVEPGRGHVFAWGDEWITYDSEWAQRPDYQVAQFWANAFTWLSRGAQCGFALPAL